MNEEYFNYIFKDHKNYTGSSLLILGINILSFYYYNRFGWFRIFGRGLAWKDTSIHRLMFSELWGHTKTLSIGTWSIKYLGKH